VRLHTACGLESRSDVFVCAKRKAKTTRRGREILPSGKIFVTESHLLRKIISVANIFCERRAVCVCTLRVDSKAAVMFLFARSARQKPRGGVAKFCRQAKYL